MRGHVTRALLLGILLCVCNGAHAAFITDKIVVNLYAQASDQGQVLKKLPSGTTVEVLATSGPFSQVRTPDNVTGWVASTFLSNEKPGQIAYLELLAKNKALEAELKSMNEERAAVPGQTASPISVEELADLQQRAKDAGWMRAELKKARDRVDELETTMKAKTDTVTTSSQQELDKLRADNKALEERLAAVMLVNEPAAAAGATEPSESTVAVDTLIEAAPTGNPRATGNNDSGPRVKLEWFLGSLAVALIAGFIAGITWLDNRIRRRHGGFRLY